MALSQPRPLPSLLGQLLLQPAWAGWGIEDKSELIPSEQWLPPSQMNHPERIVALGRIRAQFDGLLRLVLCRIQLILLQEDKRQAGVRQRVIGKVVDKPLQMRPRPISIPVCQPGPRRAHA